MKNSKAHQIHHQMAPTVEVNRLVIVHQHNDY